MGRVSIVNKLDDFHLSENWKSCKSEDYDRSERRWRRRDLKLIESSGHNRPVVATRITASKSCRNKGVSTGKNENAHMAKAEVDEDYKVYLATYFSVTDDVVADPDYRKFLENDNSDPDRRALLENCYSDPDYRKLLKNGDSDPEYMMYLENYTEKDNSDGVPFLETETGPCNKRPHQDVSSVSEHNSHSDAELDLADEDYLFYLESLVSLGSESLGISLNGRGNSQASDQAFDTPKVQSEIDGDYNLYLNSDMFRDGDWLYTPNRNTTKYSTETNNEKDDSNSSDSDLILLEPNQVCENTPFIPSKAYDSSVFENEEKPIESKQLAAYDPCHFRRRLMEHLERPYDQKEYDSFMLEVCEKRKTERHRESRRGPIKSYHSHGFNNSYLEMYSDFEKAIDEFKEHPHKVLFLLRGFFFWLQNVTYGGIFKPWQDEICLEILRKM